MEDWLEGAAAALDVERIDPDEARLVLRLARDVAHGVERRMAPLASYLAGLAAGRALDGAEGQDGLSNRVATLRDIVATLQPLIGPEGEGPLRRDDPEQEQRGPMDG